MCPSQNEGTPGPRGSFPMRPVAWFFMAVSLVVALAWVAARSSVSERQAVGKGDFLAAEAPRPFHASSVFTQPLPLTHQTFLTSTVDVVRAHTGLRGSEASALARRLEGDRILYEELHLAVLDCLRDASLSSDGDLESPFLVLSTGNGRIDVPDVVAYSQAKHEIVAALLDASFTR